MRSKIKLKCPKCHHRWFEVVEDLNEQIISEACPKCHAYPIEIIGGFSLPNPD